MPSVGLGAVNALCGLGAVELTASAGVDWLFKPALANLEDRPHQQRHN